VPPAHRFCKRRPAKHAAGSLAQRRPFGEVIASAVLGGFEQPAQLGERELRVPQHERRPDVCGAHGSCSEARIAAMS
jgi:hypothetical protein